MPVKAARMRWSIGPICSYVEISSTSRRRTDLSSVDKYLYFVKMVSSGLTHLEPEPVRCFLSKWPEVGYSGPSKAHDLERTLTIELELLIGGSKLMMAWKSHRDGEC